jgi:hypothetical protein
MEGILGIVSERPNFIVTGQIVREQPNMDPPSDLKSLHQRRHNQELIANLEIEMTESKSKHIQETRVSAVIKNSCRRVDIHIARNVQIS